MKDILGHLPKAFCAHCGRPVRPHRDAEGRWSHSRCPHHEQSLRIPEAFIWKAFATMRAAVDAADDMTKPDWRVNNPMLRKE